MDSDGGANRDSRDAHNAESVDSNECPTISCTRTPAAAGANTAAHREDGGRTAVESLSA
jgi:hypothetical protein